MNSHIQQPKCILKQFQDDDNQLYYYDIKEDLVKRGRAKSLNTEKGYYSQETEEYLGKMIESPLGVVLKEVLQYEEDSIDALSIETNHLNTLKRYGYSSIIRGKKFQKNVISKSKYAELLDEQSQHDLTVKIGIDDISEEHFLDDFVIVFVVNKTDEPFVLPLMGLYEYWIFGKPCLCLPISPQLAIWYWQKDVAKEAFMLKQLDSEPFIIQYGETEEIHKLNKQAFWQEKIRNGEMVISNKKEILEKLAIEVL